MICFNKKIRRNKFLSAIPLVCFLSFIILPLVAEATEFGMSVDFLVQTGVSFYDKGRLAEAMHEFRKALTIDPNSVAAKEFFNQIQREIFGEVREEVVKKIPKALILRKALDEAELKRRLLKGLPLSQQERSLLKEFEMPEKRAVAQEKPVAEEVKPDRTVILDESIKGTTLLEANKGSAILIQGDSIKRFLNTTPEKFSILRHNENSILVIAKEIGDGIFHIWDDSGRWTFNLKIGQTKHFEKLKEDFQRRAFEENLSSPFKITYSLDKSTFHSGRRIDTTERQSLSFNQSVAIRGETPYGNYDSSFSILRLNKEYGIDNLIMGLTDAHFWGMEHINIRVLDYGTGISSYKFPNADLRGVRVDAPMFNKKLSYTTFWGSVPEGSFTRLSPGLGDTVDAHLTGVSLFYRHSDNVQHKFYYARSYGPEINKPVLTNRAFGWGSFYKIGNLNFDSEVAYDDDEHISYTTRVRLRLPKTNISLNLTDDDRDFASPLGGETGGGSTTANLNLSHSFNEDVSIANSFSATRDRDADLVNPDDPKRPNYRLNSSLSLRLDTFTRLNFSYDRNDNKGSISPSLSESKRISLNKQIFFIKKLNTYLDYVNSTDKNFTTSTSNYDRNSIRGGFSFNFLDDFSFSISKTANFIENRVTRENSTPHILDMSISYYSRILESPFYGRFRVSYRDEEQSESDISFLSGEDRLEFQAGLDYRPSPNMEGYLALRVANVWAEKEGTEKHIDAEIRYGLRFTWDTGFRWNTKGHVKGFVFYDLDGDGIKDRDEEGVKDVTVEASSDKSATTNEKGYYLIKSIAGRKADVSINMNTIPRGHILTTPSLYEVDISHMGTKRLDFGITTRSDIVGIIFVDLNGNNKFDREDEPISAAVVILDGEEEAVTDDGGQYHFRKLSPGQHTLKIDLKTIPTQYIPKVPLKTTIDLEKGTTFFYNIPLRVTIQEIK